MVLIVFAVLIFLMKLIGFMFVSSTAIARDKKKKDEKEGYKFTDISTVPLTSVKPVPFGYLDQDSSAIIVKVK